MKKLILTSFLAASALTLSATAVSATQIILDERGDTFSYNGATFHEFTVADQETVSSGTGVIDPFLTIHKNMNEEGYNSDYKPLVMDTQRPKWNHSITVQDLIDNNFELLLDINEPDGTKKDLTQHELQVYVLDDATDAGDFHGTLAELAAASIGSAPVWDLDGLEDSTIELDYGLWNGSGQNIDMSVTLPNLFDGFDPTDYVYVYAQFGQLAEDGGYYGWNNKSQDGFEEYCLRTSGTSVPEPSNMLLLGTCLAGLAGIRLRWKKKA